MRRGEEGGIMNALSTQFQVVQVQGREVSYSGFK